MNSLGRQQGKQQVGPDWAGLIDKAYDTLDALGVEYVVHEVKEKFGELRFYFYFGENAELPGVRLTAAYAAIDALERESGTVCEECGAPGEARPGGWVKTLCTRCAVARDLEQ